MSTDKRPSRYGYRYRKQDRLQQPDEAHHTRGATSSRLRFRQVGAQSVLDLRAVRLNGDWALYQGYLQQRKRTPCPEEALVRPLVPEQPELRCAA